MSCDPSACAAAAKQTLTLTTAFDWLAFIALATLLGLFIVFALAVAWTVIGRSDNRKLMIDKLTQLLSEGDTSKMSLSRVQALLFTYVITFGTLLIITRTGAFPPCIPDDLAILAGGSLGTFLVSKAIQGSTPQGPPGASPPPPAPAVPAPAGTI
jgi:hypothetical protein